MTFWEFCERHPDDVTLASFFIAAAVVLIVQIVSDVVVAIKIGRADGDEPE